jgi:hypothetical protein
MRLLETYQTWILNKFDLNKPQVATFDDWEIWHAEAKKKSPIGYFLAQILPDKIDDIWRLTKKPFNETRWWIRYRLFDKYHIIKTGLQPGYHDFDERCLHGMFALLVDYVEVDLAWKHSIFYPERKQEYPWYSRGIFRFRSTPKPEYGIEHLKWESTLDSKSLPIYERSDYQAENAREVLDLYHWWKYIRPLRVDPMELSGWSKICDENNRNGFSILSDNEQKKKTAAQKQREREALDRTHVIEEAYQNEDTQQLVRLIKIRHHLWT